MTTIGNRDTKAFLIAENVRYKSITRLLKVAAFKSCTRRYFLVILVMLTTELHFSADCRHLS